MVDFVLSHTYLPTQTEQATPKYIGNSVRVLISRRDICFHSFPCERAAILCQFLAHADVNENRDATWDSDWPVGKRLGEDLVVCLQMGSNL